MWPQYSSFSTCFYLQSEYQLACPPAHHPSGMPSSTQQLAQSLSEDVLYLYFSLTSGFQCSAPVYSSVTKSLGNSPFLTIFSFMLFSISGKIHSLVKKSYSFLFELYLLSSQLHDSWHNVKHLSNTDCDTWSTY